MPKSKNKKKISFTKIIIVLLALWGGIKLYDGYQAKNAINYALIPNPTSKEISESELKAFLPVWADYMQQNISELGKRPVSLASGAPEDNLSDEAKEWLLRRLWYPKRFFYVEQRLRAILKTLDQQEQSNALIADLSKQYEELSVQQAQNVIPDPKLTSQMSGIENMIHQQQQQQNVEQISDAELNLIAPMKAAVKDTLYKYQHN